MVDGMVVIGEGGRVRGGVTAGSVLVKGKIEGDVRAGERAEVAPSGTAEGDIEAPRVVIAEGAFFKGNVKMSGDRGVRPGAAARDEA